MFSKINPATESHAPLIANPTTRGIFLALAIAGTTKNDGIPKNKSKQSNG